MRFGDYYYSVFRLSEVDESRKNKYFAQSILLLTFEGCVSRFSNLPSIVSQKNHPFSLVFSPNQKIFFAIYIKIPRALILTLLLILVYVRCLVN